MWKNKDDAGTQPSFQRNISTYREAVEEFSSNAAEFLKCVPSLNNIRDAYQRAMSISSEVRQILDTGDETLRTMMRQIEEAVNAQFGNRPEKKKPEMVKVEPIKSADNASSPRMLP